MTPEQALDQMLKNTGIHWRFTGPNFGGAGAE